MSVYVFPINEHEGQFEPLYFDGYFSPDECDHLVNQYKDKTTHGGGVVNATDDGTSDVTDNNVRRVDINVVSLNDDNKWLYDKMTHLVQSANEMYNFDLTGFMEEMQLLKYTPPEDGSPGGHYRMHSDTGPSYLSTRKLSVIVQLTDPSEYEGCDTHLEQWGQARKGKGDVIVFPSPMLHYVTELTEGHREALVVWVNGPPFR